MKHIGIIGGGQLGKMMILEAKKLGFEVTILDPSGQCPAHSIADSHIVAPFSDADAIRALAESTDVLTFELEHINTASLKELKNVHPSPHILELIQDKFRQKQFLRDNGFPVPDLVNISSFSDLENAASELGYPFVIKTCAGGYDGRGNRIVSEPSQLADAFAALTGGSPVFNLIAERYVRFTREVSVLSCRSADGDIKVYPVAENHHMDGILIETLVPAGISKDAEIKSLEIAEKALIALNYVGLFCVELFVTDNDDVLINELAPRPHNSGHYTIEACATSQFENHIRAVTGLPLGSTKLRSPAVMHNLLGIGHGKPCVEGRELLRIPELNLHIYGKSISVPGRKMGHFTICANSLNNAKALADEAASGLRIVGDSYKGEML